MVGRPVEAVDPGGMGVDISAGLRGLSPVPDADVGVVRRRQVVAAQLVPFDLCRTS